MIANAWGSVGEWFFGAATVAALVWAVLETRRSRKAVDLSRAQTDAALDLQRIRDLREVEQAERAQAALISCRFRRTPKLDDHVSVEAFNHSATPVYEVRWFQVVGLGSSQRDPYGDTLMPGTAPGQSYSYVLATSIPRSSILDRLTGVTFRDNAGLRWVRWSDGELQREADDLNQQIAGQDRWTRGQFGQR